MKSAYNIMGRKMTQMIKLELDNLDKDQQSRNSAMKSLKSLVKDLDSISIPVFLVLISETNETRLTEFEISLYEDIARVHGPVIVPYINSIMLIIVKTLSSNPGPLTLHQTCSKAVSAIARYGIDPTTPEARKQEVMHSLCKPLSDSLLSRHESLSSGAACCLKGLVELDDWRFCSSQTVNEVCQRVAAGLESDAHMGLVMALAKRNGLVVEGYARLLVRAGVRVLNAGVSEGDSRKRLSAIRMVNCLMMSLDYKSIMSELTFVIEEFQKFQLGEIVDVNEAVSEGILMAKRILWSNADVSFKDGLLSGQVSNPGSVIETLEAREDYEDEFSGFMHGSAISGGSRSRTPSPPISRSYVNGDSSNRFTSPRKLSQHIHVSNDGSSRNQKRRFRSSSSSKFNQRSNSIYDQKGFNKCFTSKDELYNGTSEMVSSTEDIPTNGSYNLQEFREYVPETRVKSRMSAVKVYSGLIVLLFAVVWCMWVRGIDEGYKLVPT